MIRARTLLLILVAVTIVSGIYLFVVVRNGFSTARDCRPAYKGATYSRFRTEGLRDDVGPTHCEVGITPETFQAALTKGFPAVPLTPVAEPNVEKPNKST